MDPTFKGLSTPVPDKTKTNGFNFKLVLLVTVGFLAVVVGAVLLASNLTKSSQYVNQRFIYRMEALTSMASKAQADIGEETLAKTNAELSLVLSGDTAIVKKIIPTVKTNKTLSGIRTEETDKDSLDSLKSAKINGIYDMTYKRILSQKIQTAMALATEVNEKSSSKELKTELERLSSHLQTYYDLLTEVD